LAKGRTDTKIEAGSSPISIKILDLVILQLWLRLDVGINVIYWKGFKLQLLKVLGNISLALSLFYFSKYNIMCYFYIHIWN
jgi:hypothetical protein